VSKGLGRKAPKDWTHVERYPLTADTAPSDPTPAVIGVNWYQAFDRPEKIGNAWWVGRSGDLGRLRGGHCVCLRPKGPAGVDDVDWWQFYDQGSEGACVGFGVSRMLTLMNRRRYLARWVWDRAKEIDYWPDTNPGDNDGTSVNHGLYVVKTRGAVKWSRSLKAADADWQLRTKLIGMPNEGIAAFRWTRGITDTLAALCTPDASYVTLMNSWGRDYPHYVRMPVEVLERLWREDGEIGLVTDR
jgi:hypothetical protein